MSTPDVTHTTNPDGFMWLSNGTGFGGIDPSPFYQVDLGADYTLTGTRFFNYNEAGGPAGNLFNTRGIKTAHVTFKNAAGTQTIDAGALNFNIASGAGTEAGQFFDLTPVPVPVRFIRLDNLVNWGSTEGFFGISEMQFEGTAAPTPEAASFGLMAIAGCGALARRGRRPV